MKKGTEINLLKKKWRQMVCDLKSYLKSENPDQLHQFRVQVKKIKSLLILYTVNKKNKNLMKIFRPVKMIFHHAGAIRDSYMHLQLADQFQVNETAFHQEQTELMFQEMTSFKKKGRKYVLMLNKTLEKIKDELQSISKNEISDFYASELNNVVLALAKREFNEDMHDCRKRLKNLLYNQKLANKSMKGTLKLNLPYLDQVQDLLGQWHDGILARDLFSVQMNEEQEAIDKLNLQIEDLEESIVAISTDFWQKATKVI